MPYFLTLSIALSAVEHPVCVQAEMIVSVRVVQYCIVDDCPLLEAGMAI